MAREQILTESINLHLNGKIMELWIEQPHADNLRHLDLSLGQFRRALAENASVLTESVVQIVIFILVR